MNRHHSEGISFPLSIGLPMLKHILQGVGSAKQFAEGVRQHDEGANGQAHSLEEDIITYKVFTLWNRICNIRGLRERTTQSRYKFDENGLLRKRRGESCSLGATRSQRERIYHLPLVYDLSASCGTLVRGL